MTKKKEKRGRKAIPVERKKPPQPTIKINEFLHPFVKLLKVEYKAKRVDAEKLNALTHLLLDDNASLSVKKEQEHKPDGQAEDESEPELSKTAPSIYSD